MKKNFFYFAMALCVALCTVSCGSDDDGDSAPSYTPQKYEKEATAFTLEDRTASNVIGSGEIISVTGLNFTESGKAIIETTHLKQGKTSKKYSTYDAEIDGNKYIIKDGNKEIGTVINNGTRGSSEGVEITINVTLTFDGVPVTINPDHAVEAIHKLEVIAASQGLNNITRTWTVQDMKLTLDFDNKPDASVIVQGGSLREFQELAEEHNIILTEKDRTALNRSIVGLTLDKFGLFTVTYSDKFNDAAEWSWVVGSNDNKIKLTLKDEEMGHKFLNSNAGIDVQYSGNDMITMVISVRLEEDKCTAYSILNLK